MTPSPPPPRRKADRPALDRPPGVRPWGSAVRPWGSAARPWGVSPPPTTPFEKGVDPKTTYPILLFFYYPPTLGAQAARKCPKRAFYAAGARPSQAGIRKHCVLAPRRKAGRPALDRQGHPAGGPGGQIKKGPKGPRRKSVGLCPTPCFSSPDSVGHWAAALCEAMRKRFAKQCVCPQWHAVPPFEKGGGPKTIYPSLLIFLLSPHPGRPNPPLPLDKPAPCAL